MKNLVAFLSAAAMVFLLAACGGAQGTLEHGGNGGVGGGPRQEALPGSGVLDGERILDGIKVQVLNYELVEHGGSYDFCIRLNVLDETDGRQDAYTYFHSFKIGSK